MATSQAPAPRYLLRPLPLPPKSALEAEGERPPAHFWPPRHSLPVSMGVTGDNAFPCCGKNAVDIVEKQNDPSHHHDAAAEVAQKPPLQDPKPEKQAKFGTEMDMDPLWKVASLDSCSESSSKQPDYTVETFPHNPEELQEMHNFNQWSIDSICSNAEEDQKFIQYRSIHAQTSRHLFWSDKLVQASENMHKVIEIQNKDRSKKVTISHLEQKSVPITTPPLPATCSKPQPISPHLPVSHLSAPIALSDLINFASSLAVASTSDVDLPSLEKMLKPVLQKDPEPSSEPSQPTKEERGLTEKLKTVEFQKTWTQKGTNFPHAFLDFSKKEIKTATLEGEVKFVQTSTVKSKTQESQDDSEPSGTKKGSPLLLKIHFKLLSPKLQRND
ncbi:spermatogenesis-associated protein 32 [Thomomys bottae]